LAKDLQQDCLAVLTAVYFSGRLRASFSEGLLYSKKRRKTLLFLEKLGKGEDQRWI
jgi:hypothetical protein